MRNYLAVACVSLTLAPALAEAQTWTAIKSTPTFTAGAALLLTDGSVMVQQYSSSNWFRLVPDNTGSYVNGTWVKTAAMPSGYGPLYYASAVLPDGRLIVNGGEYNNGSSVWTTLGAIYDPIADKWTAVTPPSGWSTIGDAQSTILPNGTYMLANCCTTQQATLNLSTMTWTATGTNKADINDEEGWTQLPSGQLLTVDANNTSDLKFTEIMSQGVWATAGDTPVELPDTKKSGGGSHELGPQVLRPDGTVFAVGATGYTAVYDTKAGTWTQGPSFPQVNGVSLDSADGPGALLPNGNVLVAASPGVFNSPTSFFEFDGTKLNAEKAYSSAAGLSSYQVSLLVLPNGQIMATNQGKDIEFYTPTGKAKAAWAPRITQLKKTLVRGQATTLGGTLLNGMSQAVAYGDDYQAATNYPIVRVTNTATGHVFYGRTANHSSMGVANRNVVTTQVTLPKAVETGPSSLVVVANGIASKAKAIVVK